MNIAISRAVSPMKPSQENNVHLAQPARFSELALAFAAIKSAIAKKFPKLGARPAK